MALIPVLVGGASMPGTADLPESIQGLAAYNALVMNENNIERATARLISWLEHDLEKPTGSAPAVFISHSHQDDAFVTGLAADLRKAGFETWVDHENIVSGHDWDASVEGALDAADALILVLSSHSVSSQNVKVEWSYFLEQKKPVHPIKIAPCRTPFRLRLLQTLDFSTRSPGMLDRLIEGLRKA